MSFISKLFGGGSNSSTPELPNHVQSYFNSVFEEEEKVGDEARKQVDEIFKSANKRGGGKA